MGCLRLFRVALLAAAFPLAGFTQQTLSLREAIRLALTQNPQMAVSSADERVAVAEVSLARTELIPRLSAVEDISRGNDPVYAFGTKLRQQRFAQSDFSLNSLNRPTPIGNFATRLSGQWMAFNWFETQHQIQAAQFGVAGAHAMTGAVQQALILQVVQAYQAILYAQRQVEVARHEEQTAEALVHDAQARVQAGLAIDSDLLAAQVNLTSRQQENIATVGQLETAWAELETATGQTMARRPTLRQLEAKSFPKGNSAEEISAALKARPDLEVLRKQSAMREKAVQAARSDFLPQVSAYGTWEMDRETFAGSGGNNWVAGVQLNIDILPFGKRAHLAEMQAARARSKAQEQSQEQQIRLAVERAITERDTAERTMATAQASIEQSAESLRILRNRYQAGLATMTDILRAEDAERQSQASFWRAVYGNAAAYANLLYATGQLTPDTAENLE